MLFTQKTKIILLKKKNIMLFHSQIKRIGSLKAACFKFI